MTPPQPGVRLFLLAGLLACGPTPAPTRPARSLTLGQDAGVDPDLDADERPGRTARYARRARTRAAVSAGSRSSAEATAVARAGGAAGAARP